MHDNVEIVDKVAFRLQRRGGQMGARLVICKENMVLPARRFGMRRTDHNDFPTFAPSFVAIRLRSWSSALGVRMVCVKGVMVLQSRWHRVQSIHDSIKLQLLSSRTDSWPESVVLQA
mmetsp:Transcript_66593/g.142433  ORF Transcript_66593/g.142433 Transcript_66593/m.142433 type:complete len:117 (+) Transcript_66593:273-623(+)